MERAFINAMIKFVSSNRKSILVEFTRPEETAEVIVDDRITHAQIIVDSPLMPKVNERVPAGHLCMRLARLLDQDKRWTNLITDDGVIYSRKYHGD